MKSPIFIFSGATLLACAAQTGPEYRGEPLATISGSVVSETAMTSVPPGIAQAAIIWEDDLQVSVGASVGVEGSFPASFTMRLYAPPPRTRDDALPAPPISNFTDNPPPPLSYSGSIRLGWIVALSSDADPSNVKPSDIRGYSLDTRIGYVADPQYVMQWEADRWKFPPTKGYHLLKLRRSDRTAYDACRWNGVCISHTGREKGLHAFRLAAWQEDHAKCLAAFPGAPTCNVYAWDVNECTTDACVEQSNTDVECKWLAKDCGSLAPIEHIDNPEGLAAPITVTMGATFRDVNM